MSARGAVFVAITIPLSVTCHSYRHLLAQQIIVQVLSTIG